MENLLLGLPELRRAQLVCLAAAGPAGCALLLPAAALCVVKGDVVLQAV